MTLQALSSLPKLSAVMNPLSLPVLRLMTDGRFHSGEAIARALGVSRGTVWNALRDMGALGIQVHRVPGRGYQLAEPIQWLDAALIERLLAEARVPLTLEVLDCVASTNTELLARVAQGAPHGLTLAAEVQTAGRGRAGRPWYAVLGGSLAFSLLWRFEHGVGALRGLSPAVGLAIARALEAQGARGIQLKWPNDLVYRGRKLAGILIEVQGDALGPTAAVIGIGLNVRVPADLAVRAGQPVASLTSLPGFKPDRSRLLAALLIALYRTLERFAVEGFAPLRREWEARHAYHRLRVRVTMPDGRTEEGVVWGVGEGGELLLDTGRGRRRLAAGEVSLRPAVDGEADS